MRVVFPILFLFAAIGCGLAQDTSPPAKLSPDQQAIRKNAEAFVAEVVTCPILRRVPVSLDVLVEDPQRNESPVDLVRALLLHIHHPTGGDPGPWSNRIPEEVEVRLLCRVGVSHETNLSTKLKTGQSAK